MRCGACGYDRAVHDLLGKCPLCACGEVPAAHDVLADGRRGCPCGCGRPAVEHLDPKRSCGCVLTPEAPAHACRWAPWWGGLCPGRRSKTSGEWLLLRQATFREPAPPDARREWFGLLVPVIEAAEHEVVVERVAPPLVPARPPLAATEFASTNRGMSAAKLGRKARELGWDVEPSYWVGFDGSEGCAVKFAKGELRAVALWRRAAADAGKLTGWKTDVAYAWRMGAGRYPTKVTHTDLERLIT